MLLGPALLACAAWVAPATLDAVVRVESGGNPLAIHINGYPARAQPRVSTLAEAVTTVQALIDAGRSVDIGLGQLNSRNLGHFGYSVADAFDSCKNLAASGTVLSSFYARAVHTMGEGQPALLAALSGYNTGSLYAGFQNGYVNRYVINASLPANLAPASRPSLPVTTPVVKTSLPPFTTVAYDRPGYNLVVK